MWLKKKKRKKTHGKIADLSLDVKLEAGGALEVEDLALDAEVVLTALLLPLARGQQHTSLVEN
jgi:hypothetical protein